MCNMNLLFLGILFIILNEQALAFFEIGNLPSSSTIHENTKTQTSLYAVVTYPMADSCSVTAGGSGKFDTGKDANSLWEIRFNGSDSLDYDDTPYTLTITCKLTGESDVTGTFTVNLIENVAPTYHNLPGTVTVSAKTVSHGHAVFTVSYTDPDTSPPLSYSPPSNSPSNCPFNVTNDNVEATSDLTSIEPSGCDTTTTSTCTCVVTFCVKDTRDQVCGQEVTITITDVNRRPVITNLDETVTMPELTAGRTLVYDIDYYDADDDPIQFEYVGVATDETLFELIGATGEIYIKHDQSLNYEDSTSGFVFKVKVNDGIHDMAASFSTLTLTILDVNEAPLFNSPPASFTNIVEGMNGDTIGTVNPLCTDVDSGDSISYQIITSTYSTYFNIHQTTAVITRNQDWDYEDSSLPTSVTLTVRCSDNDGLSDDATVTITMLDVNDNVPVCTVNSIYHINYQTAVGTYILNPSCTDADSGANAALTYTKIGTGYGETNFNVASDGNVTLASSIPLTRDREFKFSILVTDGGSPSLSTTVTVSINFTAEVVIHNVTYVDPCYFCTTTALSMFSLMMFFALCLVLCGCYFCIMRCAVRCDLWKQKREIYKVKKRRCCRCCRRRKEKARPARPLMMNEIRRVQMDPDDKYMKDRDKYRQEQDRRHIDEQIGLNKDDDTSPVDEPSTRVPTVALVLDTLEGPRMERVNISHPGWMWVQGSNNGRQIRSSSPTIHNITGNLYSGEMMIPAPASPEPLLHPIDRRRRGISPALRNVTPSPEPAPGPVLPPSPTPQRPGTPPAPWQRKTRGRPSMVVESLPDPSVGPRVDFTREHSSVAGDAEIDIPSLDGGTSLRTSYPNSKISRHVPYTKSALTNKMRENEQAMNLHSLVF